MRYKFSNSVGWVILDMMEGGRESEWADDLFIFIFLFFRGLSIN